MQSDNLIIGVIHQEAPVAPMSVGVADQVIDHIHHVELIAVMLQNIF